MGNKFKMKIITTSFTLIILLFILISSAYTYAWFTKQRINNRENVYQTGDGDVPAMTAWIFDMTGEGNGDVTDKDSGTWRSISSNNLANKTEPRYILQSLNLNSGTGERYTLTSLHLGTVDNLMSLNKDNYLLMRFDVTNPATQGKKASIKYEFPSNYITAYKSDGTPLTTVSSSVYEAAEDPISLGYVNIDSFEDFIVIEYAIANTQYEPNANYNDIDALYSNTSSAISHGILDKENTSIEVSNIDINNPYYLYFRISPSLSKCIDVTDYISIYMPCQITFDIHFILEFYDITA